MIIIDKNTAPHDVEQRVGVVPGIAHFGIGYLEAIGKRHHAFEVFSSFAMSARIRSTALVIGVEMNWFRFTTSVLLWLISAMVYHF
jgi:hypothetical protein